MKVSLGRGAAPRAALCARVVSVPEVCVVCIVQAVCKLKAVCSVERQARRCGGE